MTTRHSFTLSGNGSAVTDTGVLPVMGSVDQVHWIPTVQDTGPGPSSATLDVLLMRGADTGLAVLTSATGVLGNDIVWSVTDTGGHKIWASGDATIKVRATPGDTGAFAGKLHVYTNNPEL